MDMTIRHLRVFVAVCRERGVTRAAQRLHMTQPAVTRAIQELERHYGVRLFERLGRRLSLTACGERAFAEAVHLVDAFDGMERGLRSWEEQGVLRVGATITLGTVLLPAAAAAFERRHPALRVEARVARGEEIRAALLDNRLDLALVEGELGDARLLEERFLEDRLVLVAPPGDPLLARERLRLALVEHVFAARGVPLAPLRESASTRALVRAAEAGLGVALLPERLVRGDIAAGRVGTRAVEDEPFVRGNYLVRHRSKFLTPGAQEFLALCRTLAAEDAAGAQTGD